MHLPETAEYSTGLSNGFIDQPWGLKPINRLATCHSREERTGSNSEATGR